MKMLGFRSRKRRRDRGAGRAELLANWLAELDSAALYAAIARTARDRARRGEYEALAATERAHAQYWERRLRSAGHSLPRYRPSWRTQLLIGLVRLIGARFVLPSITAREMQDRDRYAGLAEPGAAELARDEQAHAALLRGWTDGSLSASLRAAVLGANDGLASNFCLLMGVAGGGAAGRTILLAGVAGLTGGACAMALGEWLSVTNARELAASQLERAIGEKTPAGGHPELAALGNAAGAASVSFCLFALGAVIPLLPFTLLPPGAGTLASIGAALVALFGLGVVTSLFNGRTALYSGARQMLIGAGAAAATYLTGRVFGVLAGTL
ncbi:MAG TPA: VIT1/CCC1 transporter family protein [Steroidobacteraceae bacterium]|nr:VIT1/CCC1 transporter family protein [Steroidobacteraceae bacterium]